jgi:hypothetical protein
LIRGKRYLPVPAIKPWTRFGAGTASFIKVLGRVGVAGDREEDARIVAGGFLA